MGGCSGFALLRVVPLLRSPQDISPPSFRRSFCICSMADESRQRCHLAEDCNRAVPSHCGREWADRHAFARVYLTRLHPASCPICVLLALLHGIVERQAIVSVLLPQPRQRHTKAKDILVLCLCIYDCFIFYMLGHHRLQVFGRAERPR